MKAIEFLPAAEPQAAWAERPDPTATGHDLVVKIEAVGLNPVDTKVRPGPGDDPAVLGYDAAGTVLAAGPLATGFAPGDAVYYAGDVSRPGTNSELHLVDSRIVGKRPATLEAEAAAALPLTALTAWESLFDRLGYRAAENSNTGTLLIIGGAGGVGSIAIQLATWAGLTVIATASREESAAWCRSLGAAHVIDHHGDIPAQLATLGFATVDAIANFHDTVQYWETMGAVIAPQGRIVMIVEPAQPLPMGDPFKRKSVTLAWEFMFTRSLFKTADIGRQREILEQVAALVDAGALRSTAATVLRPISPATLAEAHRLLGSGRTIGKIVAAGWE